jgi:flavin reductase (DIM6/NTAB) family NADH-FMN oxidoreductase RutF
MEELLNDLVAHNLQNRTAAVIENGTWAATSGRLMREKLQKCANLTILDNIVSVKSGVKAEQVSQIVAMADAIIATFPKSVSASNSPAAGAVDPAALYKLSYGLFVLTTKDGNKDNGCIINTVSQIADSPVRIAVSVRKTNYSYEMIAKTGEFNVSILDTSVPFRVFEQFGFCSGRDTDKFADCGYDTRAANGIRYVPVHTNGFISAKVVETVDCGSHGMFIAEVVQASVLSQEPSVTYQYYFDHIKPAPKVSEERKQGFVCKICGYLYEGDALPSGYVCPLCKHGPEDFEPA